jgi:DNA-binding transcriptional regulator YiaG/tetratricopeptide (TPR) repeat protein
MTDEERPSEKRTRKRRRATGDRTLGDRIRKFRTQLNLSQAHAAHQIGRTAGWLLQVENGRADPGYSDLLLLAPVLKRHISELVPIQPTAECESGSSTDVDSAVEPPVDRREFGKVIVGSLLGLPTLLDWERIDATLRYDRRPDPALLEQVQQLVSAITTTTVRQLDSGSPELLTPMLQGALTFVQSFSRKPDDAPELADATSRLALLYGWLSFQLDSKAEARRVYRFAARTAKDGGLTDIHATVLAAASQLDSTIPYGGYQSSNLALVTLDRAESLVNKSVAVSVLRAWILARRAQERAALGDFVGAERDLAGALQLFQASAVTGETFYAYPGEGWIIGYQASCNRLARRWAEAEDAYGRVLSMPSSPSWRSVTMSSLASVQARQEDPDRAAGTLRQAVALAIETNTPLRLRHIYGARAQLDRFRDTPAVQEFDQFLSQVAQV